MARVQNPQREQARLLLNNLFNLLQTMVHNAMEKKSTPVLTTVSSGLETARTVFTSEQSPILQHVADNLDAYQQRINCLRQNVPEPERSKNGGIVYQRKTD
jgi:hypothetical protein